MYKSKCNKLLYQQIFGPTFLKRYTSNTNGTFKDNKTLRVTKIVGKVN